jgi:hypothetical protein
MEKKGLLFIPDISGFTRFVSEVEIEHSRMVIQELLEVLLASNKSGLQVSEIEGDAILFYKFGDPPSIEDIYAQVQEMFCSFHSHLLAYDHNRYCYCKACNAAVGLTLKIITHYGEFAGYKVQQFEKLIGKDVIVAHQLLKNDIPDHEYWLVTGTLTDDPRPYTGREWIMWNSNVHTSEAGQLPYHYAYLTPLKKQIKVDVHPDDLLKNARQLTSHSTFFPAHIYKVCHACGDFNLRHKWQDGVIKIEEVSHALPRIGMKCKKIHATGQVTLLSSNYFFSEERIEFVESEQDSALITQYILEKMSDEETKLTVNMFTAAHGLQGLTFMWFRKAGLEKSMQRSLENLQEFLKNFEVDFNQTPDLQRQNS